MSIFHELGGSLCKIPIHLRTSQQRYEYGKSLRDQCPHKNLSFFNLNPDRDPIALLMQRDSARLQKLLPLRYQRMSQSAFHFFRGTAGIMAYDLAHNAFTPYVVQLCGDAHLMNFGGFATPERRIIFEINDFDETYAGPFDWDLKRLMTSFIIAGQNQFYDDEQCQVLAMTIADTYRDIMQALASQTVLQNWYFSLEFKDLVEAHDNERLREMDLKAVSNAMKHNPQYQFSKMAQEVNNHVEIRDRYPLIFHPDEAIHPDFHGAVCRTFDRYLNTLPLERRVLLDRYEIQDSALKVVGVGSVGTLCAIILLMAGKDDPLFLQLKEAQSSVLENYVSFKKFKSHGQRVVYGQKLMQSSYDILLGHFVGESGRHYYVRQLRDIKVRMNIEKYGYKELLVYAQRCAWALARAHARSGDPAILAGYMGSKRKFSKALTEFAFSYAEQNERDYQLFLQAIKNKQFAAEEQGYLEP